MKAASVDIELEMITGEEDSEQQSEALTKKCGMNLKTLDLLPIPKVAHERDVIVGKDGKEKELLLESVDELRKKEKKPLKSEEESDEEEDDDEAAEGRNNLWCFI